MPAVGGEAQRLPLPEWPPLLFDQQFDLAAQHGDMLDDAAVVRLGNALEAGREGELIELEAEPSLVREEERPLHPFLRRAHAQLGRVAQQQDVAIAAIGFQ